MNNANKRIAKNTIYLYIRMLFTTAIGLYTVRAILNLLGETDYGIYNVVGGCVTMLSFISGTLSTSSQRYFSMHIAQNNTQNLNQWFCLNINLYAIIAIACIVLLESIGLWFINTQLTIPEGRIFAANIVYQLSVLSFCIGIFQVPYMALVIAHEKMNAFAYIGVIEGIAKLVIVVILSYTYFDRLIMYGILLCLVSIAITFAYIIYCRKHFNESKYKFYWNNNKIKELASFSNWHLLGTISNVIRGQGINILLNVFFSPVVNAARAIAYQVENAVLQLNNNFFVAVKPQIYKYYSLKETENLHTLIFRSTQMSFFLTSILSLPLLFESNYVLTLWLIEVPEYAVIFTRIILVMGIIDSSNGAMICPILATGEIRNFYIATGLIYIATLPISYIALKLGAQPYVVMIIALIISIITMFVRMYFLKIQINLTISKYIKMISSIFISIIITVIPLLLISQTFDQGIVRLICSIIVSTISLIVTYYYFVITNSDRKLILSYVKNRIHFKR